LYTGTIFDYRIDANNQVTYLMRMDGTIGTFNFGEVGLYTDTGTLFALCSLTVVQEKIAAGVGTPGNIITFEARCVLSNVASAIAFPITTVVNSKLPELASVENLPVASDSNQSNGWSIQAGDENGNACIALRNSAAQTWAFSTHTGSNVSSTVTSATTTSVTAAAISTLVSADFATRRFIIEFTDGALKSVCRYITSSSSGVVNFAATATAPLAGVTFTIWRSNVSVPASVSLTSATPAAEIINATAVVGVAVDAARADHRHAMPALVTTSVDGFMSAADKTKLDSVASSAAALTSATPAAETISATAVVGVSTTAARADHVHAMPALVTTTVSGFMSAADKTKLDGISAGAGSGVTLTTAYTPLSDTSTGVIGTGTFAAREDHRHPIASAASLGTVIGTPNGIAKGNGAGVFSAALTADVAALLAVNGLLKSNGSSTITAAVAATDYVSPSVATTFTAKQTFVGMLETRIAMAAYAVDLALGSYFTKTPSGTVTFTASNVPASGTVASFILDLTNAGAATITWITGTKWAAGIAPTLTVSGRDILGFYTHDGGTSWVGLLLSKDAK
jgi:hypothetical protein